LQLLKALLLKALSRFELTDIERLFGRR